MSQVQCAYKECSTVILLDGSGGTLKIKDENDVYIFFCCTEHLEVYLNEHPESAIRNFNSCAGGVVID